MSGDEVLLLLGSVATALFAWVRWTWRLLSVRSLVARGGLRWALLAAAVACAVLLLVALRTVSAHDVRDDPGYVLLYQAFGAAWVGVAAIAFDALGVSVRDDVVERDNAGAAAAVAGALLGATLCYAGSNVGDGPGWWCVAFTAALATGAWFGLWALVERTADVSESVVVERDLASGLRLGGLLVGTGLVLGRAAAGNWTGPGEAAADFARIGWPAAVLAAAEIVAARRLRPTVAVPRPRWGTAGLLPAAAYVAVGLAWVLATRPWA